MASPFQQRALRRKLIYAASIVVLLSAAWVWRHKFVDQQALDLAVREVSRGEVDLLGSVIRLGTIGSRGVATCVMWNNALDAQKRNQYNELELHARSLTKLQPHFITPWIFQSWNLSYNVSVEADRIADKYFYVARGVGLLAEGERRNRDRPYIRWSIGFFAQHKIGQSDETNAMRSVSQLSMIPPHERDPGRFLVVRNNREEMNWEQFENFCKKHPQLVHRLNVGMRRENKADWERQYHCDEAKQAVQFLADNFRVPSLYEDVLPSKAGEWQFREDKMRPENERFPILPPPHTLKNKQVRSYDYDTTLKEYSGMNDDTDIFQVSRAWYGYSQEALPPPDEIPASNRPIEDPVHQRVPKQMATIIFRYFPAQAQRLKAQRLQDEGWFDESGWDIIDWFRDQGDNFVSDGKPARVGEGGKWGQNAWQETHDLYYKFGMDNHLLFTDAAQRENMQKLAEAFQNKHGVLSGRQMPDPASVDPKEMFAWNFMRGYNFGILVTNFESHYNRALVESKDDTIRARKLFYQAEGWRLRDSKLNALKAYEDEGALQLWRDKVLLPYKDFRRDEYMQTQNFELQMKYVELYAELHGNGFKAQAARLMLVPLTNPLGAAACPASFTAWAAPLVSQEPRNPLLGGPFDAWDKEGYPLISLQARWDVLRRMYPNSYKSERPQAPPQTRPQPPSRRF